MTPEQLEAHRVRFEQRYAHIHGWQAHAVTARRDGDRYTLLALETAWQLYQWAIADADRAQRAAPGVQGGEPTPEMIEAGGKAAREYYERTGGNSPAVIYRAMVAARPPQQSAQPVAWMHETPGRVDVIHDEVKKLLSAVATDYLYRPIDKSEKYTIPLYAAAQPVEVQPLTNAQVSEGQDSNGLFPGSVASCAFTMGVRFAESKHGIKPTSSEGGA